MRSKPSTQQALRFSTILLFIYLLSACAHIQVTDKNFLNPDSKTGFKATTTFDASALQSLLPLANLQTLSINGENNVTLRGIEIQQSNAKTTVLYFGGNAFHIDAGARQVAAHLGQCPVNISLFDYRGYGRSNGTPTIENMQADALAIYDSVRKTSTGKLIVHGMSLGSFMAAYVAQHRALDGLILEATATNVSDWAYANTPWYAKSFVSFDIDQALKPIDNIKAARSHQSPALVIVGEKDKTTPQELGIKVYQAFPNSNKRLIVVPNAGHGGLLSSPETMPNYCQFLSQNT
jgi:pimeloyl-ACP methyl ester carboxylesterase